MSRFAGERVNWALGGNPWGVLWLTHPAPNVPFNLIDASQTDKLAIHLQCTITLSGSEAAKRMGSKMAHLAIGGEEGEQLASAGVTYFLRLFHQPFLSQLPPSVP
jgi:hypothetical protein